MIELLKSYSYIHIFCQSLLLFSWPHELQHPRPPCPSLNPRVCSNSCPTSQWYYPTISSSAAPFLLLPSVFPSIRVFSSESALWIRWLKQWSFSFSISPSNEYSGLISFRIDWFDLLAVQGTPEKVLQSEMFRDHFLAVGYVRWSLVEVETDIRNTSLNNVLTMSTSLKT